MKTICRILIVVACTGSFAEAAPRPRLRAVAARGTFRTGHVQYITSRRAYLDRGGLDGLAAGQLLQLLRAGRPSVRCAVERTGDHVAVCSGPGIRVGDAFRVAPMRHGSALRERAAAQPQDPAVLEPRVQALASARFHKVEFAGANRHGISAAISASIAVAAWSGGAALADGGAYLVEEVDGQMRRLPVGDTDLRLDLAFTAVRWQLRPSTARFEPNVRTQFFLWEAELSRREIADRTVLAVGRLWPWHLPGLTVLDGIQVGRRTQDGAAEVGLYLGSLPSAAGLAPTVGSWATGVYAALVRMRPRSTGALGAMLEIRAGARHAPVAGQLREAELAGQIFGDLWSAGGGARGSQLVERGGAPALEDAHVHLRLHGLPRFSGWVQLRYAAPRLEDVAVLRSEVPNAGRAYHGALGGQLRLSPAIALALTADAHADRETGDRSMDATGEVILPRLFADAGGLWLAVTVTEGWARSRGGYAQFLGTPIANVRVLARVGARTLEFAGLQPNPDSREVDGYLQLDRALGDRWRLRARSSLTVPLSVQAQAPLPPRAAYQLGVDLVAAL
ncbi:MAG: hypothetical protein ACJ8F1_11600 [Polyangia bacterium]